MFRGNQSCGSQRLTYLPTRCWFTVRLCTCCERGGQSDKETNRGTDRGLDYSFGCRAAVWFTAASGVKLYAAGRPRSRDTILHLGAKPGRGYTLWLLTILVFLQTISAGVSLSLSLSLSVWPDCDRYLRLSRASFKKFSLGDIIWLTLSCARHDWLKSWKHKPNHNTPTAMLIGDMTAMKYELNYNCLSQSIMRAGLRDVVRRTVVKWEQYIGLHATDNWWELMMFIYYWMLHRGKTSQSLSGPKISVNGWQVFVAGWHLCRPSAVALKDALPLSNWRSRGIFSFSVP